MTHSELNVDNRNIVYVEHKNISGTVGAAGTI